MLIMVTSQRWPNTHRYTQQQSHVHGLRLINHIQYRYRSVRKSNKQNKYIYIYKNLKIIRTPLRQTALAPACKPVTGSPLVLPQGDLFPSLTANSINRNSQLVEVSDSFLGGLGLQAHFGTRKSLFNLKTSQLFCPARQDSAVPVHSHPADQRTWMDQGPWRPRFPHPGSKWMQDAAWSDRQTQDGHASCCLRSAASMT